MNKIRSKNGTRLSRAWLIAPALIMVLSACSIMNMIQVPENVLLESLSVSGLTLSPAFSPTVQEYSAELPFADYMVYVTAVPLRSSCTVTGDVGSVWLRIYQTNTLTVTSNGSSGVTSTYHIKVTMPSRESVYGKN